MQARFLQGLGPVPPVLGLAVSGGGDSVALLVLAVQAGIPCRVVTVNHGLRPEAAAEAEGVAALCARLGVPHEVVEWRWDGRGNLPDAARQARRRLIAAWAGQGATVALGHTRDDVAETFLMRLARGAGLDGLSSMAGAWDEHGVAWRRPLLSFGREELRDLLRANGIGWAEDLTNDDPAYDRARARVALADLPLGLDAERLATVAGHLARARDALDTCVTDVARQRVVVDRGDVLIDPQGAEPEILRRLLLRAVAWVGGRPYPPRAASVARAMAALHADDPAAVQGCGMVAQRGRWRVFREWAAVRDTVSTGPVWDRWQVAPVAAGQHIKALGPAVADCSDWRETGLPRRSLMASPAVWDGDRLVAAPLAGFGSALAHTVRPLNGLNPTRE